MVQSDLRQFYFYQDYLWAPADFENMQTWTWGAFQAVFSGDLGAAVLQGLQPTPGGGLTLNISSGIATGDSGEVIVSPTALNPVLPNPGSSPQNSIVVLRPTSTDTDSIPTPDNPSIMVPLHKQLSFQVVVLSKIPGFQNDYPAKQLGDVIVAGVQLAANATVISQPNLDFGVISRPRKKPRSVKAVVSSYSTDPTIDDIVEAYFNTASGMVLLPDAQSVPGHGVMVIKVDPSVNQVAVSGSVTGQMPFGANVIYLDDQGDLVRLYSNGLVWRLG